MDDRKSYAEQIGDNLIRQAATLSDLNASCALLQNAVGITDGGVAGIHFSDDASQTVDPTLTVHMSWEDAWPLIKPAAREAQLRAWLALEDSYRSNGETGEGMTYLEAAQTLVIGDVVRNISILDAYPHYLIEPGARFVVVANKLNHDNPLLSLRLAPADSTLMKGGDLREWGNCLEYYGPRQEGYENYPGVDAADRSNPGNMWSIARLSIRKDSDALPIEHRLAAVFTFLLAQEIGQKMEEVVQLNTAEDSDLVCHSHDFCDSNIVMAEAFERVVGRMTWMPADQAEGKCNEAEQEADFVLWNRAWELARTQYFLAYQEKPEDAEDASADAAEIQYEALYSERGGYWYVDRRSTEGGETIAGIDEDRRLSEREARDLAEKLNRRGQAKHGSDGLAPSATRIAIRARSNPLASALLDLLQYVGGWDLTDPEHPVVKARKAYEVETGERLCQ